MNGINSISWDDIYEIYIYSILWAARIFHVFCCIICIITLKVELKRNMKTKSEGSLAWWQAGFHPHTKLTSFAIAFCCHFHAMPSSCWSSLLLFVIYKLLDRRIPWLCDMTSDLWAKFASRHTETETLSVSAFFLTLPCRLYTYFFPVLPFL